LSGWLEATTIKDGWAFYCSSLVPSGFLYKIKASGGTGKLSMLFSLSFHSYNEKRINLGYVLFRDPFNESLECALREELRAIPVD
jgi:hypothetical protein